MKWRLDTPGHVIKVRRNSPSKVHGFETAMQPFVNEAKLLPASVDQLKKAGFIARMMLIVAGGTTAGLMLTSESHEATKSTETRNTTLGRVAMQGDKSGVADFGKSSKKKNANHRSTLTPPTTIGVEPSSIYEKWAETKLEDVAYVNNLMPELERQGIQVVQTTYTDAQVTDADTPNQVILTLDGKCAVQYTITTSYNNPGLKNFRTSTFGDINYMRDPDILTAATYGGGQVGHEEGTLILGEDVPESDPNQAVAAVVGSLSKACAGMGYPQPPVTVSQHP